MSPPALSEKVPGAVGEVYDHMVDLRRHLHRSPELSFAEHATTALVRREMAGLGLEERPCPTPTGAVFTLGGGRPGHRVLLRADIDALPVEEATGLPFASAHPGVMHACGHDAHTAILLGVAEVLSRFAESLAGTITFVFQPAEEAIGGAAAMVRGGLLQETAPEAVLGCHVTSEAPASLVLARPGVTMAAADEFVVEVTSGGGHGALHPERGNTVLAAARLAARLGEVAVGMTFEGSGCVCSPGVLVGGTAANVAPVAARVEGTFRTFSTEQTAAAWERLRQLAAETADELAVTMTVSPRHATGPVRNDPAVVEALLGSAREVVDPQAVVTLPGPTAASDDVSELLARVPGCYFFVGAGRPDGTSGPHHSPSFSIEEAAMATAAKVLAAGAMRLAVEGPEGP